MIETILLSAAAFAGTNMDDLVLNVLFFSRTDDRKARMQVTAGKYMGMGVLVLISLLGAWGFGQLPQKWLAAMGLVPMALGVRELIDAFCKKANGTDPEKNVPMRHPALDAAFVTVANGADNIGVYVPLFASFVPWQLALSAVVFALLTGLWCWVGKIIAHVPALETALKKRRKIIVPAVYLTLGLYILLGGLM